MGKIKDMFLKYEEMKNDLKFLQENEGRKDDIEYCTRASHLATLRIGTWPADA